MLPIAFDTETELISPGNQSPQLICLTWTDEHGQAQIVHWKQAYEIARELVINATATQPLVGHNTAFDLCVLAKQFTDLITHIFDAYERDAISDTAVREKLINIAKGREQRSYSLATLTQDYLNTVLDKDTWRLRYAEFKEIALPDWPQGARDYALTDTESTLQVYQAQENKIVRRRAAEFFARHVRKRTGGSVADPGDTRRCKVRLRNADAGSTEDV